MNETNSLLLPRRNDDPDFGQGSVFFVGTATVVIRYAGFTILTDPNFLHAGDHVHLGYGLTSTRRTNPAVEIEDLPPLDFVLLSHLHGDHFDRVAERKLNKATPIISTSHATSYLEKVGFTRTHALKTWEKIEVRKGGDPEPHGDARHPRPGSDRHDTTARDGQHAGFRGRGRGNPPADVHKR